MPVAQELKDKISKYQKQGYTPEEIYSGISTSENFPKVAQKAITYSSEGYSPDEIIQGILDSPIEAEGIPERVDKTESDELRERFYGLGAWEQEPKGRAGKEFVTKDIPALAKGAVEQPPHMMQKAAGGLMQLILENPKLLPGKFGKAVHMAAKVPEIKEKAKEIAKRTYEYGDIMSRVKREEALRGEDEMAGHFYGAGASVGTMAMALPFGAEGAPLLFGLQALGENYPEYREAGASPEKAALATTVVGLAEYLPERFSIGRLLKGRIGQFIAGEIIGEQMTTAVQSAVDQGILSPSDTWEEALDKYGQAFGPNAEATLYQTLIASMVMGGAGKLVMGAKEPTVSQSEQAVMKAMQKRGLAVGPAEVEAEAPLKPTEKAVELAEKDVGVEQEPVISNTLRVGDTFTKAGEEFKVENITPLGTVRVADGIKFSVPEDQEVYVDKGSIKHVSPEKKPAAVVPIEKVKKPKVVEPKPVTPKEELPQGAIPGGLLAYGQELPKKAGNINLERIDEGYDVKKVIADTALIAKQEIEKARRGKMTLKQIEQRANSDLAKDLGITEAQLLKRRKGQAYSAEDATKARMVLATSANRVVELHKKIAETESLESLAEYRLALSRHAAIQAEVAGVAAEAGRALSAHRILSKHIVTEEKSYKAMLDALGGREITDDIAKSMSMIDLNNPAEVNRFIMEFAKVKKSDMIFEAWVNFLLSGPKTHIVNATSNTITYLTKPIETLIAAGYDAGRAKVTGTPQERFAGEVTAEAVGARVGLKEGVRAALRAIREDIPTDTLMKLEQRKYKAIPGKAGRVIRIPGTALIAADEFFKSINYHSELYAQAYRKAKKEGLQGAALYNKAAEIVQMPTDMMVQQAKHAAEYRTFTQPYGQWGRKLEQVRRIPGLRYIVPFMRTPTNIAKFALERTPANFVRLGRKIAKGELKGSAISDEIAKPIMGSLLMMAVVLLASEGLITGGGPKKKSQRDTLYRAGWKPYAIRIGDKYYSYGRLEPIGSVFGIAADFTELVASGQTDERTNADLAAAISLSVSKNLTSKTFLSGLSNALDAMSDPKRYGDRWVKRFSGSLVPSVVNTAKQATDPTLRVVDDISDSMLARIPYASYTLLPRRDIWGREIKFSGGALTRAFSPFPVGEEAKDPVDLELLRLMKATGYAPSLPQKRIKGVKLDPIEYDIYLKQSGERAYKMVKQVIDNQMDDDRKVDLIKKQIDRARRITRRNLYYQLKLSMRRK